jgi:hypothetical protein
VKFRSRKISLENPLWEPWDRFADESPTWQIYRWARKQQSSLFRGPGGRGARFWVLQGLSWDGKIIRPVPGKQGRSTALVADANVLFTGRS